MVLIGKVNWKNSFENILYLITGALLAFFVCYKTMRATTDDVLAAITPTIEKAIDKETIANDIVNKIEVQVDKIKKSDTLQININQEPLNDQHPNNTIVKTDSCAISISDYNKLSKSQKNRINRWLK